ncbi:hypothetical protein BJ165DRAFT_1534530 [Panaeolus papilionaceus]|nr:hypothetical protein BJ165DRAFT_1534530 [Panaeolus papilionaceus]
MSSPALPEFPTELLLKILRITWVQPMNQAERVEVILSWSRVNRAWRRQFQMISATNTWIMTALHAKCFLESVKDSHLRQPTSVHGIVLDRETHSERINPRLICVQLNFHVERPGEHKHIGLSRIYFNLLHHLFFYSVLPNLQQVAFRYLGFTVYETFLDLWLTRTHPPAVPIEVECAWTGEHHTLVQNELTHRSSSESDEHILTMTERQLIFYITSIGRLRLTPVIQSDIRNKGSCGALLEVLQLAPIPHDLQPLPSFNEILRSWSDSAGIGGADEIFVQPKDPVLRWDPNERVQEEFCIVSESILLIVKIGPDMQSTTTPDLYRFAECDHATSLADAGNKVLRDYHWQCRRAIYF